jgi:1-acyl-sn-glycerol-3-phosphate acyltransferase
VILAPSNEWLFGLALLLALWLGWRRLSAVGREANGADWGNDWLNRLDGLARLFCRRFHRLDAAPLPVPASGGALLAANHISGLDPILMLAVCPRPLRFMVAKEEYNRWWLRWLYDRIGFIPVDRQDRQVGIHAQQCPHRGGSTDPGRRWPRQRSVAPAGGVHHRPAGAVVGTGRDRALTAGSCRACLK